jgi:hypothetical protein
MLIDNRFRKAYERKLAIERILPQLASFLKCVRSCDSDKQQHDQQRRNGLLHRMESPRL